MKTAFTDNRSISPTRPYKVAELALMWERSQRSICRDISNGLLRGARINKRRDIRGLGSWALEYLETLTDK